MELGLDLKLRSWSWNWSCVGIGVGVETSGVGVGRYSGDLPELELELELKPPELELELIFWRLAGVGVGVGVETLELELELELILWSWPQPCWGLTSVKSYRAHFCQYSWRTTQVITGWILISRSYRTYWAQELYDDSWIEMTTGFHHECNQLKTLKHFNQIKTYQWNPYNDVISWLA